MNGGDWFWAVGGLAAIGVLTGGIGAAPDAARREAIPILRSWLSSRSVPAGPGFRRVAPVFVLNIVGEEFVWRGVALPRQEVAFGGRAWLVNGILWLLFHAAFPWQVLLSLVPIT